MLSKRSKADFTGGNINIFYQEPINTNILNISEARPSFFRVYEDPEELKAGKILVKYYCAVQAFSSGAREWF